MNIKLYDMVYICLRKDVYILFHINFKQMEENTKKKNFVNYDVKIIVIILHKNYF